MGTRGSIGAWSNGGGRRCESVAAPSEQRKKKKGVFLVMVGCESPDEKLRR